MSRAPTSRNKASRSLAKALVKMLYASGSAGMPARVSATTEVIELSSDLIKIDNASLYAVVMSSSNTCVPF